MNVHGHVSAQSNSSLTNEWTQKNRSTITMKESSSKTNSPKQRIRPVERINSKSKTKKEQIIKNKRTQKLNFPRTRLFFLGLNQNRRISSQ